MDNTTGFKFNTSSLSSPSFSSSLKPGVFKISSFSTFDSSPSKIALFDNPRAGVAAEIGALF